MAVLIHDPGLERRITRPRRIHPDMTRLHECWEGTTYVPPLPNNEHQVIQFLFSIPIYHTVTLPNLGLVMNGINVSDRVKGWKKNYRIPDLCVFLNDTTAVNHQTHWVGGPDFMIEILSPGEDPTAKFDFYASVNTREILLVDRAPWALELFRLIDGRLVSTGRIELGTTASVHSQILPLSFALQTNVTGRPQVVVTNRESRQQWLV